MEVFTSQFQIFIVFFARMMAMLSISPGYGGQVVSYFSRISIAFIVSLIVTPVTDMPKEFYILIENKYLLLILEQVFIGFLIGFTVQLLFAGFQMAGEFFSVQMGFGVTAVFDPLSQVSLPLLGSLKNLMGLYVFFVSGSHLWLIKAVVFSFEHVPFFSVNIFTDNALNKSIFEFMAIMGSGMFLIAIKIALPVMGSLFLVSLTLGVLSKAAPQMNILMLGFPLKIFVGFLVLAWISPILIHTMFEQFDILFDHLNTVIKQWG